MADLINFRGSTPKVLVSTAGAIWPKNEPATREAAGSDNRVERRLLYLD
jgi:hypothetical protein